MVAPGLEPLLAHELQGLGVRGGRKSSGGVELEGSIDTIRRINLWSRIASRVLQRVNEFHASSFHELERRAKRIEWSRFVREGQAVRFRVTCRKSRLYHSDAVMERFAKAVVGEVRGAIAEKGADGADEEDSGAQLFIVRIFDDVCTVSADSSGALLHRRGYRLATAKAPLRETLAAAMLAASRWDHAAPLVDPMCGAGTIPIEAALMARRIAPGLHRRFAFEDWPDHDAAAWSITTDEARSLALDRAPGAIIASDRDAGAVKASSENADRAGVLQDIELSERTISDAAYPATPGWIITNPPYGLRIGGSKPLRNLYAQLGRIVRERAPGFQIALLSADKSLESQMKLDLREVFRTSNGGIPVRLVAGG